MKVKHNFSKDATALLLGCLYLLGTSLQAQFGGGGLEQAKPPVTYEAYGLRHCFFGDFYRFDKWFLPTSEKVFEATWHGYVDWQFWCKMESNGKYSWWFQGPFESDPVKMATDQPPPEPPNITGTTYDELIEFLMPVTVDGSRFHIVSIPSTRGNKKLTLTPINTWATSATYQWSYVITNNTSRNLWFHFTENFNECHRYKRDRRDKSEWVLKSGSTVHGVRWFSPNKKVTISSRHPQGWFAGDWLAGKFNPPTIKILDGGPLGGP